MLKTNKLSRLGIMAFAAFLAGTIKTNSAHAATESFNDIANNIIGGISNLPGFLSAISYMMGMLFSILGILKIKDHVENPTQAHLKDGAIRLAVGGGLFMIPAITASMQDLIGTGTVTTAATVKAISSASSLAN